MIVVIADDFTGAAELGGIGLRYGLSVRIETKLIAHENLDLLVIATDTRSCSETVAKETVFELTRNIMDFQPEFIYKKTDSVLRGHARAELDAFLQASHGKRVLLVQANPALGRVVYDGHYYIHNVPLHQTSFADDPEFPRKSSFLLDLLGTSGENPVIMTKPDDRLADKGIIVCDAKEPGELQEWALASRNDPVAAGASGFFVSILEQKGYQSQPVQSQKHIRLNPGKRVFVCGSSFKSRLSAIADARTKGVAVSDMPWELYEHADETSPEMIKWQNQAIELCKNHENVILAINKPFVRGDGIPQQLKSCLTRVAWAVMNKVPITELFVEGGATAFSIIQRAKFTSFKPVEELAHGVLCMQVVESPDLYLTIKPGSYVWPKGIWPINNDKITRSYLNEET